jgi:hypothetical protein
MKNLKYIIVPALSAFMFTACNNEVKGPTQAEIDTQVEVKVKAATDQLKADCDSRIMEAAQLKADSMMAKTVTKKVEPSAPVAKPAAPAPKPTTPKVTTPKVTTPVKSQTIESGGMRGQSDQTKSKDKNSVEGGGMRNQSDQNVKKDVRSIEGGGMRGQSDESKKK